ncbi:GNAT family N-acetyltransferase [Actinocrinis puniceicyclus]|uniref:GNAT family N-acetyltransferase n=1 Tax=Actinocrinis puniceicyclus TaxID=977794 RepID=A0A8J7WNI3_9ACTN|nr:GNAT family N-acetyltransferase [Actinocrinis puniceicyclus]MBS2965671.1 GNAT family N-acetyltransferase [Actinocrinis puniceicyclus]
MIRPAAPDDVPAILAMVRDLAEYERARHEVAATEPLLSAALFGEAPAVSALIAQDEETGEPVGFALWFLNFSTWLGRHGIYLEDLYVKPHARGAGHGRALLTRLAQIAVERGYGRVEWSVVDWNAPSIGFYKSLGALPQDEWTTFRLTGDALDRLGAPLPDAS